jgi:hypothetical protein
MSGAEATHSITLLGLLLGSASTGFRKSFGLSRAHGHQGSSTESEALSLGFGLADHRFAAVGPLVDAFGQLGDRMEFTASQELPAEHTDRSLARLLNKDWPKSIEELE